MSMHVEMHEDARVFQVLGSMFDMIISCSRVHLHTDVFGPGLFPSLGSAFQIAMQADRRDKSYLSKSVIILRACNGWQSPSAKQTSAAAAIMPCLVTGREFKGSSHSRICVPFLSSFAAK